MKTDKERMLAGELYLATDAELREDLRRSRQRTRLFNQTTEEQIDYRTELLKELFESVGKNPFIEPPFRCDYGCNITVGDNFFANFDCVILDVAKVKIGNNVMFAPRVGIYSAGHPLDAGVRTRGLEFGKEVTIGNNVWIGANATVNPGVTIGDNVVIGSGSVVTKDISANVVAAGNPCRVIREITEEDKKYWEQQESVYHQEMAKE